MNKYFFALMLFLIACAPEEPVAPVMAPPIVVQEPPVVAPPSEVTVPEPAEEPVIEEVTTEQEQESEPADEVTTAPETTTAVKEFTVRSFQFGYEPERIEVNKGDKVVIKAYTSDVPHGFKIPQFGVDLFISSDNPNNPDVVEFVADFPGTFTFSCSVFCGAGHGRMKGTLVVKP